jgi:tetratricopeptide (TPR) repeat protein
MQSIIKKVVWVCLLIIPFVALYVASGHSLDLINLGNPSGLYFPFISGKNLLFRFLVGIAFFGWTILALRNPAYRLNWKKSPLLIAYGTFMAILLVADLAGTDPFKSMWSNFERMEGFVGHIHLFAYFVVLSAMLHTAADYGRMFKYFIASNVAVLVFGYGQLLGANGYIFSKLFPSISSAFSSAFPIHMSENRLDATLGNSAYFAIYCLMFAFLAALLWSQKKDAKYRWFYPTLIVLNVIALFYTGTRGTQIGLIVGSLVALAVLVFRWTESKKEIVALGVATLAYLAYLAAALFLNNVLLERFALISYVFAGILIAVGIMTFVRTKERLQKMGAGVFIAIVAGVLLFQGVKDTQFVRSSPTLARLASISTNDVTSMSRLSIWKISYEAFQERPILGYGQDNFSYIYASRFLPEKMYNLESWYDRSHDVFFDWLVAAGALGLVSYLSLYVIALWLIWRKKNDMHVRERAIITGLIAGYFVHNIFVFDNLISYILFFFLLAYIAFRTATRGEPHGGKAVNEDHMKMLWLPVIGMLFLATQYYVNYLPLRVNKLLVRGLDVNRLIQTRPFAEVVKIQEDAFKKAVALNTLGSTEAREQFMQSAARMSQVTIPADVSPEDRQTATAAVASLVQAARTEVESSYEANKDDVRMLSIYGMFYNGIGDGVSAERVLSRAHELAPKKQLVSFDLVRAYLLQNKFDQSYALAKETYDLAPAYADAAKVYALAAVYAKKWNEAREYIVSKGQVVPFDSDILSGLVATGQTSVAIGLLNELKRTNPEYAGQVDAYIKELLAAPKK